MTDLKLNLRLLRDDGQYCSLIDVRVIERRNAAVGGDRTYDVKQTDAFGVINDVVLRPLQGPSDLPVLDARISDSFGNTYTTERHLRVTVDLQTIWLPESFNMPVDQPATDPAPAPDSPSDAIDRGVRDYAEAHAPGYVFMIRKDGAPFADATRGFARVAGPARAMTNNTIVHLASMSKPITATALVAMIDDWTAIRDAVAAIGQPGADMTGLTLAVPGPLKHQRPILHGVEVPAVLAPMFVDSATAASFLGGPLPESVGDAVRQGLQQVAQGALASPPPVVPPGHLGLLRRVLHGVAVPDYSSPFLPLIRARLEGRLSKKGAIAPGVEKTTIEQLLIHQTVFVNADGSDRQLDPSLHSPQAIAAVQSSEPSGGLATYDYWGFMRLLLSEPYYHTAFRHYSNHNYTLLTMVIEACTETSFDHYVTQRLFADPRFSHIRRRVVEPNLGALYYQGSRPNWTGGVLFSDYSNWPGNGGFYATASELTDWMHALFAGLTLTGNGDDAPLITATGLSNLFGTRAFFSGGIATRDDGPAATRICFQHNGGTGGNGGSVNGNLAIFVPPDGAVYSALFVANGNLDADRAFTQALRYLA